MFKKTMKFDDLEGNEVEQTFYFNYNKKEIAELLEFKQLEEKIQFLQTPISESGLTELENSQQAYNIFQDLILDAYGQKGADNVTFVKNDQLREYFRSHVAFVELIFEFLNNPSLGAQFIENCLPTKMVSRAKAELAAENEGKLTSETLGEMVQEAARRQQDPATRIEPGLEAAVAAGVASPELLRASTPIAPSESVAANIFQDKSVHELTEDDILAMSEDEFAELDPQKLSKEQMVVAFRRKLQG